MLGQVKTIQMIRLYICGDWTQFTQMHFVRAVFEAWQKNLWNTGQVKLYPNTLVNWNVCVSENDYIMFRKEHLGQFDKEVNYVDEVEFLSLW